MKTQPHKDGKEAVPDYDVVVVGGGMAGVFAALGASKHTENVLLIEQSSRLGGQGTLTGERGFCGDIKRVNTPFQQILEGLRRFGALGPYKPTSGGTWFKGEILAFLLQEKVLTSGVDLLFHTCLVDATSHKGEVQELLIFNKSGLQRIKAKCLVDCTGDGDLAAMAGFPTVKGGKPHNPDGTVEEDMNLQLPMSLCFWMEDVGEKVNTVLPPGCPQWENDEDLPMTSVKRTNPYSVFVKMKVIGGDSTDGNSYSRAEIRARRHMTALAYYLQTKGYRREKYDTYEISHVSPGLGVREGRRIVGEYVMSEDDVRKGRRFADAVAVGTYQIDYHWPHILQRAGTGVTPVVPPYQIPLRSLIPKGGKNIAVAGRCVSGDQMAMASFRVMTTCAQTGLAAGTVCGIAAKVGMDVSQVDPRKVQGAIRKLGQVLDTTPYREHRRQKRKVSELVMDDLNLESCYESTHIELENGETLVAWSGRKDPGTRTGIWTARRAEEQWSSPTRTLADHQVEYRNPVLHSDDHGGIYLFYRVIESGQGSHARLQVSQDGGRSWSPARDILSQEDYPGGDFHQVVASHGDEWLIPISRIDGQTQHISFALSKDKGDSWQIAHDISLDDIPSGDKIRPVIWESEPGKMHMLVCTGSSPVYRSDSHDSGRTWSRAQITELKGEEPYMDLTKMNGGQLVLGHYPSTRMEGESGRVSLVLALSEDNGKSWPHRYRIQDRGNRPGKEVVFSNPALTPSPEGISLTCIYGGGNIAFRRLSVEHIRGEI